MLTLSLLLIKYSLKPDFLHDKANQYLFNVMIGAAIFCDVLFGLMAYSLGILASVTFLLELTAYAVIVGVLAYIGGYIINKLAKGDSKALAQTGDQNILHIKFQQLK